MKILITPPTTRAARAVATTALATETDPEAKKNGNKGIRAPTPKVTNDADAA